MIRAHNGFSGYYLDEKMKITIYNYINHPIYFKIECPQFSLYSPDIYTSDWETIECIKVPVTINIFISDFDTELFTLQVDKSTEYEVKYVNQKMVLLKIV